MTKREELYRKVPPPADPIPVNVKPFHMNNKIPDKAEIRVTVKWLCNDHTKGVPSICATDIKLWLWGSEDKEKGGQAATGDKWGVFVHLIHIIC